MRSDFQLLGSFTGPDHPELVSWHGNVGEALAIDLAGPLVRGVKGIDVLCWNVAIGLGRLQQVVEKLKAGEFDGEVRRLNRPLIVLVQEAYRADTTVPDQPRSSHHGGKSPRDKRADIVDIANALGMSLRYAPSMRNGRHRSDRGNAILSSVNIAHARAFPLPHVKQRRVAVAVELEGLPWLTFVTAHLDTRGGLRSDPATGRYGSGRAAQARAVGDTMAGQWGTDQSVVIGADLNSLLGVREPLLRELQLAGFERLAHEGRSRHTFHAPGFRMLLDHILVRSTPASIASVKVQRLDESKADRERFVFGSDHHPLLARIEFAPRLRRIKRQ